MADLQITHVARLLDGWRALVRHEVPRFLGTRVIFDCYTKLDAIGQWQNPQGWLLDLDDPFVAELDEAIAPHVARLPAVEALP